MQVYMASAWSKTELCSPILLISKLNIQRGAKVKDSIASESS